MMRVLAFPAAPPTADGCAYYRLQVPLDALMAAGRLTYQWMPRLYAGSVPADVVIGQRVCDPSLAREWQLLKALNPQALFVYELDDDLWSLPALNPARRVYTPDIMRAMEMAIGVADRVIVSTHALRVKILRLGLHDDVRVCPNRVPRWLTGQERAKPDWQLVNRPVLGWSGSAAHNGDLATVVPELIDRLPLEAYSWHWIGGDPRWIGENILTCSHVRVNTIGTEAVWTPNYPEMRYTSWIPGVENYLRKIDFDVAVIPLADNEFNRSKSPIKAMEMAALGIPVVARAGVDVYEQAVVHGVTGFLYRTKSECHDYVSTLLHEWKLRRHFSIQARAHAEKHFTIDSAADVWLRALMKG